MPDQTATKFEYRLSEPYRPILGRQDIEVPAINNLDWENQLKGIDMAEDRCQFNFVFQDGTNSGLKTERQLNRTDIKKKDRLKIRRILV